MTAAQQLFIAVLKHKGEAIIPKIKRAWLDEKEVAQYKFLIDYYKEHGELPGVKSFCKTYGLEDTDIDSRPAFYLQKVKDRHIFTEISENIPALLRKVKEKPKETLHAIKTLVADLDSEDTHSKDTLYSDETVERITSYFERARTGGVTYLSMGNALLDKLFYGYRKSDLITIGGRAGSRKTFLICLLCLLAEEHLPKDFGDILFLSNEMPDEEIKERMDCIRFKLPFTNFLEGKLSRKDLVRYREGLEELRDTKSRINIIYNCTTIDELHTKIGLYKPSIIFIDGSYLLEPQMDEGWQKITYITRNLKQIAKNTGTPIVNTTALKRASGTKEKGSSFDAQDDFAYANSYVQDSDLAIRLYQTKDMVYKQNFGMQIAKARRVKVDTDLQFYSNLTTMEMDFHEDEIETEETITF